jgi:hypothetical protein
MSSATSKSNFTGIWKLNLKTSILRGPPPEQMLVEIEHREPTLIQHIVLADAEGRERRLSVMYEVGAKTTNLINGATASSSARWQGAELVIETWMNVSDREVYFQDHWSLSDDGRTLSMVHRDDALVGQISLFERVSPAETMAFDEKE